MEIVWFLFIIFVILLILFAVIWSNIKSRKLRKESEEILPQLRDHIKVGCQYNIFLNHGRMIEGVRFLGITKSETGSDDALPWPLQQWIIVEKDDGKRMYIKPTSIRFYEDA